MDEWLLVPLSGNEARDLLEIVEARHKRGSTIFSSQFTPAGWHGKIGEGTLADAILDRIVHDSYTILLTGKNPCVNARELLINRLGRESPNQVAPYLEAWLNFIGDVAQLYPE